jgi:hypothetical protein
VAASADKKAGRHYVAVDDASEWAASMASAPCSSISQRAQMWGWCNAAEAACAPPLKAAQRSRILGDSVRHELQSDEAVQLDVLGL